MPRKYKHKKLGWTATQMECGSYYVDSIENTINAVLVENSDDREEVKEKPKYAKNGMYLGQDVVDPEVTPLSYSIPFDTKENLDKREKKMSAYRKILLRQAEVAGDREPDWLGLKGRKYYVYYNFELNSFEWDRNTKWYSNQIYFSKEHEIPEEIKQAFLVYYGV